MVYLHKLSVCQKKIHKSIDKNFNLWYNSYIVICVRRYAVNYKERYTYEKDIRSPCSRYS